MALVDLDSWALEFTACEKLSHKLRIQIIQRDALNRRSLDYNRHTAALSAGLQQFANELKQLQAKIATASNAADLRERRMQHANLQAQLESMQKQFNKALEDDRNALFGSKAETAQRSTNEPSNDVAIDVEAVKQRQATMIEEQNNGLETLSQTISRQRQIAMRFGREVEEQNGILDNLMENVERVDAGVQSTTQNITQVDRRDSTWGYWLVIGVLFVAIVLVTVL